MILRIICWFSFSFFSAYCWEQRTLGINRPHTPVNKLVSILSVCLMLCFVVPFGTLCVQCSVSTAFISLNCVWKIQQAERIVLKYLLDLSSQPPKYIDIFLFWVFFLCDRIPKDFFWMIASFKKLIERCHCTIIHVPKFHLNLSDDV